MLSLLFKFKTRSLSLEETVLKIQQGDKALHNQLLSQYKPFIKKTTSSVCKRYIDDGDDEFSIGLIAFNEAIENYSEKHGTSLLSFAQLIIKRRVIDYLRKEDKHKLLPYSLIEEADEDSSNTNDTQIAIDTYQREVEMIQRKEEIIHFTSVLKDFGLTFQDIVQHSPKHKDTRENMIKIANLLANNEDLLAILYAKKQIPIKQLVLIAPVSKKTIERNRKYIISMVIIMTGDYLYLKDYLKDVIYQ